jgi:hypothetical protein
VVTNRGGRKGRKRSAEIAVVLQALTEYLLTVRGFRLFLEVRGLSGGIERGCSC